MKTKYLFPHQFKTIGWPLLIIGVIFGIVYLIFDEPRLEFLDLRVFAIAETAIFSDTSFFSMTKNNVFDEIIALLLIIGSVFIVFSKEKSEDEYISKVRLESLVWATYFNYAILILSIIFVYDLAFLWILVFNMFTILFFFIIRFNWVLVKSKNAIIDEK